MLIVKRKINYRYSLCECQECGADYTVKHSPSDLNHASHLCELCSNPSNQVVDQALLKKFFNYDPITGLLTWKLPTKKHKIGEQVGGLDNGYLRLKLGKVNYRVHRLIWIYMTGKDPVFVDHIDHNRANNSWSNLREVDRNTNARNKTKNRNSTTGVAGVSFDTTRGKYKASIRVNGKSKHLGYFDNLKDAKAVRKAADVTYGYHSNHGN